MPITTITSTKTVELIAIKYELAGCIFIPEFYLYSIPTPTLLRIVFFLIQNKSNSNRIK